MAVSRSFGPRESLLLAVSAGLVLYGLVTIGQSLLTLSWPSTTGRITYSSVTHTRRSTNIFAKRYRVKYNYQVDGKTYASDRYMYGLPLITSVMKHRPGSEATVFYNPNDPGSAVLDRGIPGASVLAILSSGLPLLAIFKPELFRKLVSAIPGRRSTVRRRRF